MGNAPLAAAAAAAAAGQEAAAVVECVEAEAEAADDLPECREAGLAVEAKEAARQVEA